MDFWTKQEADEFLGANKEDWAVEEAQERLCSPEYVTLLWSLIRFLYDDFGQSTGGPLHCVLDDGGVGNFTFERKLLAEQPEGPIRNICSLILDLLEPLAPEDQG